jgi:hypothetical protein
MNAEYALGGEFCHSPNYGMPPAALTRLR